jgi:polygalacturonase
MPSSKGDFKVSYLKLIACFLFVSCPALNSSPWNNAFTASQAPPPGFFTVRDFGARGDGTTLDTESITKAIKTAHDAGGGTVLFPAGVYLTGTFELLSNVTLDLEAGAVLQGSKNLADYGSTDEFGFGHNYGVDSTGEGPKIGIIIGRNVQNVAIVGRGAIDGNGDSFFDFDKPHYSMDFDPQYTRNGDGFMKAVLRTEDGPVQMKPEGRPGTMIICTNCRNVLIRDVTLRNAPNWTVHFNNTEGGVVTGIHIWNNPLLPNNDGFDCFGCRDVHFSDCDIHAGDDDFAILNSTDVTISNCALTSRSSGIRVEATHYSTFENLVIHANRGIGIYERGIGTTDHLLFSEITMETHLFTGHWWGKGEPIYIVASKPSAGPESGQVRDISFSNITGESENSIVLYGSPEAYIHNVSFENIRFKVRMTRKDVSEVVGGNFDLRWTAADLSKAVFRHDTSGLYGRFVDGLKIHDLNIEWGAENPGYFSSAIECEDFSQLDIDGFLGRQAPDSPDAAAISLVRGKEVSIRNSRAKAGTGTFLFSTKVQGERLFVGNDLSNASLVFKGDSPAFEFYGNYLPGKRKEQPSRLH